MNSTHRYNYWDWTNSNLPLSLTPFFPKNTDYKGYILTRMKFFYAFSLFACILFIFYVTILHERGSFDSAETDTLEVIKTKREFPKYRKLPNYDLIEPVENEDDLEMFDYFSFSDMSGRRGTVNEFRDPSVMTFTNQTEEQTRSLYRYIFRNLQRYASNLMVYPYYLTYGTTAKKNFPDGSFINIESETTENNGNFEHFETNDGDLTFHKAKAIYDLSIAVMKVEVTHNGIYKDLFYESDVYCSMTVTFIGHWGVECLRRDAFLEGGSSKFVFLNVTDLDILDVKNFGVLVLPDIILDTEDFIVDLFGTEGIAKVVKFVNDGGMIYASAKSVALLSRFGLFPSNAYIPNWAVYSQTNVAQVKGCYNSEADPDSGSYRDYVKQLLCFGQENLDVYMLSSYRLRNVTATDPAVRILASFDTSDPNLRVKRLDVPNQNYDAWNNLLVPYLLHKEVGKGNIVLNMANPGYHSDYFGWFFNALFLAMGKSLAYKQGVDFAGGKEIPAVESGVRLTLNTSMFNVFNKRLEQVEMKFLVPKKVEVLDITTDGVCESVDFGSAPNEDLNSTGFICRWDEILQYDTIKLSLAIEILDQSVTQKRDNVVMGWSSLVYNNSRTNKRVEFEIGNLLVDTKVAAVVRCMVNPDPSSFYPIPGEGAYIDNVMPCENKEDTLAYDVEHVAIVPMVTPAVDGNDQSKVIEILTFWNEYYEQVVNLHDDYPFPLVHLGSAGRDYDILDFQFLANKGVLLNANWDTAVKSQKMQRDNTYPDMSDPNITITGMHNVNYSTTITNKEQVLRQTHFADSDKFYEHATQQLLVFIDTTTEDGASAKYFGDIHAHIPAEDIRPAQNVAKTEYSFIRSDVYFYNSLGQYVDPLGVNHSHVISLDHYPLYGDCYNGNSKIQEAGYFNKSLPGGLKYNEWGNELLNRCDKVKLEYDNIENFIQNQGLNSIEKTRYLIPINDDKVNQASDLRGFDEATGDLIEYPDVKFKIGYSFILILSPADTRRGGYFEFTLPADCPFDAGEDPYVFFSADHVAYYDTEIVKASRYVKAYFKRGLMPNENWGKDSIQQVFIENMNCAKYNFSMDVNIYELKYDITKDDNEDYEFIKTDTLEVKETKYFSLPAIKMSFKLNRSGDTSMKEYELIEPMVRYGVYYQELLKHRTVWGLAESHLISDPGQVSKSGGFSLISQVGISSIPFIDYLTVGSGQVIPAGMETSRIEWTDIWNRRWITPLRSVFPDVPPIPPPLRNFMMTSTFEVTKKGTNERVFEWDSEEDELDIFVKLKLKNNYPKYFEITTCQENEVYSESHQVASRIFDPEPFSYQMFADDHPPDYDEYLSLGHQAFYGECMDESGNILSAVPFDSLSPALQALIPDLHLCSQNLLNVTECLEEIKNIPTVTRRPDNSTYTWNYSPDIDDYYPTNYIKDNMWDLTHYDYDDNAFDKAYKYHMDNNLPSIDKTIIKPHNIIAQPIFKGYGYEIVYDNTYSVSKYPSYKGWWSDNLQNKDHTVLAGHANANDYSVNKPTDDLIPNWIEITDLEPTGTDKFNRVDGALKNIYVCLFNRHRIEMRVSRDKNVYETNIYQNNVIPIIPSLDRYDSDYTNYDCDTGEAQYTPDRLSEIDNRIYTTDSRDWLYFASNLRGGAKETVNVVYMLKGFEDREWEGDTKVNDGGRFVYWNPANGPNSFLIVDNPVSIIKATRCDLDFEIELFPKSTNTFNAHVYHALTIRDLAEIDRQYATSSYINHYGFGDVSTSVYVGGTMGSTAFISESDRTTYVKITIYNNAGFDFNMFGSAIDFNYEGSMPLNANDLMYNLVHSIKVPLSYNFMSLNVPAEIAPYLTIEPSDHNKYVTSLFFDFQNINVVQIMDGFKADYFYKITLNGVIPDALKGRIHEIGITLNEEHFESLPSHNSPLGGSYHDYHVSIPSIKFGIPFGSGSPTEYQGKVYHNLGLSTELTYDIPLNSHFEIHDAKFITDSDIETLRTIAANPENMIQNLDAFWSGIADSTIDVTELGEDSNGFNVYQYDLSSIFDVFPKITDVYYPPQAQIQILLKSSAPSVPFGTNVVDNEPSLDYNACGRSVYKSEDLFTYPNYRTIHSKGPFLSAEYEYEFAENIQAGFVYEVVPNQNLYPHDSGQMVITVTITNVGSDVAYNFNASMHFDLYPYVTVLYDYMVENSPYGYSYYLNQTNEWNILDISTSVDLSPGMMETFEVYIDFTPEEECLGLYEYEGLDEERIFIEFNFGDMDLTNVVSENSVRQQMESFSIPYTLRNRDTVLINVLEKDNGACNVKLEAIANYPIVDGEYIYYNFYWKNHSEDTWLFIERKEDNILEHEYYCQEETDYRCVTQNRLTDMDLASDDWALDFIPWAAIALSISLTFVVALIIFMFVVGMLILCIFTLGGVVTSFTGVKNIRQSVRRFTINFRGEKAVEFETVGTKYLVRGKWLEVIEKVKKVNKLPAPPKPEKGDRPVVKKEKEVKQKEKGLKRQRRDSISLNDKEEVEVEIKDGVELEEVDLKD